MLIENNADINATTATGRTPLHYAARHGYINIVKILLTKGANINAKTKRGQTVLDCAKIGNHTDIVELIIRLSTQNL